MERDTIVFHLDWCEAISALQDDGRLKVYEAVFGYAFHGTEPKLTPVENMAFTFIRKQLDRECGKRDTIIERNRINGRKGGRPKKNPENPKEPKKADGFFENPKNPTVLKENQERKEPKERIKRNSSLSLLAHDARVRVDDVDSLFSRLKMTAWYESVKREIYRHTRLMPTDDTVAEYIDRYKDQLTLTGQEEKTESDLMAHFVNWLRTVLVADKKKNSSYGNKEDRRTDQGAADAAEFAAHIEGMLSSRE